MDKFQSHAGYIFEVLDTGFEGGVIRPGPEDWAEDQEDQLERSDNSKVIYLFGEK